MTNIEKYRNAFISVLELEETPVWEELALGVTREWDSIGHMGLMAEMEDIFDVSIDSDWITEFNTYLSGMGLLTRLGVDFVHE